MTTPRGERGEIMIDPATGHPVISSTYLPGAIGRITELHAAYYSRHWGFDLYFEAKVATELSQLLTEEGTSCNGFWTASLENRIIGGVAIDGGRGTGHHARLRFLILEEGHQGNGIGHLLMDTAVTFSRELGFPGVYLTTFAGLDAARHLYEKWGFVLTEEQEARTWGTVVREQRFDLTF